MTDPAVVVEDLRVSYGETTALDGVSLSIPAGEVLGLLGPNGAGKTTLVRAITGTVAADEGRVRVFGRDPAAVERSRLGVLPQQFAPPDRLTAAELLRYYAGLYDDPRDPAAVAETVGVAPDDVGDAQYRRLSGGQQRRVCLGTALVSDPDLLVLDEPAAGIDPAGRRRVRERVETLAAGGTTVLVTGHDVAEVRRLSDRVALLADGTLIAAGPPGELVRAHGGPARLVVETDGDPDPAALESRGYEATAVDRGLVVPEVDPTDLDGLVAALADAGVDYDALRWSRPDLEDVYLALTGRPDLAGAVGTGDLELTDAVAQHRTGSGSDSSAPAGPGSGAAPDADPDSGDRPAGSASNSASASDPDPDPGSRGETPRAAGTTDDAGDRRSSATPEEADGGDRG